MMPIGRQPVRILEQHFQQMLLHQPLMPLPQRQTLRARSVYFSKSTANSRF